MESRRRRIPLYHEYKIGSPVYPISHPNYSTAPFQEDDVDNRDSRSTSISKKDVVWKIVYFLFFVICLLGATSQIGKLLDIYFRYLTSVAVSIQSMTSITLPGITFCSSIGVRRSGLESMDGFKEELSCMKRSMENQNETLTSKKNQELLDKYYYKVLDQMPIDSLIHEGLNFSEFVNILETKCALDDAFNGKGIRNKTSAQCRNHINEEYIETFQGTSICWTLFHDSIKSELRDVVVPSGDNQSPVFINDVMDGTKPDSKNSKKKTKILTIEEENQEDGEEYEGGEESEDQPIQPLEIIRFMINFTQSESVKLDKPALGSVSVHDTDQIRLGRLQSTKLKPGFYYEIYIEQQESQLLEAPYETNCYPYNRRRVEYLQERKGKGLSPHPLILFPLSSSDCLYGCLGNETVKKCKCWPPEIPYVKSKGYNKGFSSRFMNESLQLCSWYKKGGPELITSPMDAEDAAMSAFFNCLASPSMIQMCKTQCQQSCSRTRVKSTTQERLWPSDERIKYAPSSQVPALRQYRRCCSVVSVRLSSSEYTLYSYTPKYETIEFISYVGGIVSLWLGFTFIGIFDYLKYIVKLFVRKRKERLFSGKGRNGGGNERLPFFKQDESDLNFNIRSQDLLYYYQTRQTMPYSSYIGFDFNRYALRNKNGWDKNSQEHDYYRRMLNPHLKLY
jgi:hypothetical protein